MKKAIVLVVLVLFSGLSLALAQETSDQSESWGSLTDSEREEQLQEIQEILDSLKDNIGTLAPIIVVFAFLALRFIYRFLSFAYFRIGRLMSAKKEMSDHESDLSKAVRESIEEDRLEEVEYRLRKSRRTIRFERTITDGNGTRGVPIG